MFSSVHYRNGIKPTVGFFFSCKKKIINKIFKTHTHYEHTFKFSDEMEFQICLLLCVWFQCYSVASCHLHRKPTVQTLSVFSSRWFWRTITLPGCQHVTLTGTWALPKRVDPAEGHRPSQTSKRCTSWSAFRPASSRTCSTAASPPLARETGGRRRPALAPTHNYNARLNYYALL